MAVVLPLSALAASDPGVRAGPPAAGGPLADANPREKAIFQAAARAFTQVHSVRGGLAIADTDPGLGPRFNLDSCAGCHAHPTVGGTSPAVNPQVAIAKRDGAANEVPWFVTSSGPVREARFVRGPDGSQDGTVANLYTISGRADAPGCVIAQPDFGKPGDPVTGRGNPNLIFRIPTPLFGAGLVEAIPDSVILAGRQSRAPEKARLGISGHANRAADGTVARFGWKAQNKSLLAFAGEAYNVEMGVTNELFPNERDETPSCLFNPLPEDGPSLGDEEVADAADAAPDQPTSGEGSSPPRPVLAVQRVAAGAANYAERGAPKVQAVQAQPVDASADAASSALDAGTRAIDAFGDVTRFTLFMRMLAPPARAAETPSIARGRAAFEAVGCALCHTPSLVTGAATTAALHRQTVELYSDLLVHRMGARLADGVTQGTAGPDEFRTAPLWGVGQRLFFLHDGRTSDLAQAIAAHAGPGSEASGVVERFDGLRETEKQELLEFLRSL
jgi:CxxC motif-containing protein (DUF1111 family)